MHSDFLSQIRTQNDKAVVEMAISEILLGLGQPGQDSNSLIAKYLPIRFSEHLFLSQDPDKDLRELQNTVKSMDTIDVTLAIDPTLELVNALISWFRNNLDATCIVQVHTDSAIGAGVKLVYKGKYIDLSIASKIAQQSMDLK